MDTAAIDLKAIGPIGLLIGEQKGFSCGTFDHTAAEWAALDSAAAVLRSKGGVLCY